MFTTHTTRSCRKSFICRSSARSIAWVTIGLVSCIAGSSIGLARPAMDGDRLAMSSGASSVEVNPIFNVTTDINAAKIVVPETTQSTDVIRPCSPRIHPECPPYTPH